MKIWLLYVGFMSKTECNVHGTDKKFPMTIPLRTKTPDSKVNVLEPLLITFSRVPMKSNKVLMGKL